MQCYRHIFGNDIIINDTKNIQIKNDNNVRNGKLNRYGINIEKLNNSFDLMHHTHNTSYGDTVKRIIDNNLQKNWKI